MCDDNYDVLNDSNIKQGNIIRINLNPCGEMIGSTLIFGEGKKDTFKFSSWTNLRKSACGYIYETRDGIVGLSLNKDEEPFLNLVTTNIPVMVYDPSLSNEVYAGDESDLTEAWMYGYKVIADIERGVTRSFSVIKSN